MRLRSETQAASIGRRGQINAATKRQSHGDCFAPAASEKTTTQARDMATLQVVFRRPLFFADDARFPRADIFSPKPV
jgi:hypothetical protein